MTISIDTRIENLKKELKKLEAIKNKPTPVPHSNVDEDFVRMVSFHLPINNFEALDRTYFQLKGIGLAESKKDFLSKFFRRFVNKDNLDSFIACSIENAVNLENLI